VEDTLTFSHKDLKLVNAMDYIRLNESMFFAGGGFDRLEISQRVQAEALARGVTEFHIHLADRWTVLEGNADPFLEIVPFPEGGPNSFLAEVLLVPFVSHVVTAAAEDAIRVVSGGTSGPLPTRCTMSRRAIAFASL
jgi:hypothetical protein